MRLGRKSGKSATTRRQMMFCSKSIQKAVEQQRNEILAVIEQNPSLTTEELAFMFGTSTETLKKRHLQPLAIEGKCHSRACWFLGKKPRKRKGKSSGHSNQ